MIKLQERMRGQRSKASQSNNGSENKNREQPPAKGEQPTKTEEFNNKGLMNIEETVNCDRETNEVWQEDDFGISVEEHGDQKIYALTPTAKKWAKEKIAKIKLKEEKDLNKQKDTRGHEFCSSCSRKVDPDKSLLVSDDCKDLGPVEFTQEKYIREGIRVQQISSENEMTWTENEQGAQEEKYTEEFSQEVKYIKNERSFQNEISTEAEFFFEDINHASTENLCEDNQSTQEENIENNQLTQEEKHSEEVYIQNGNPSQDEEDKGQDSSPSGSDYNTAFLNFLKSISNKDSILLKRALINFSREQSSEDVDEASESVNDFDLQKQSNDTKKTFETSEIEAEKYFDSDIDELVDGMNLDKRTALNLIGSDGDTDSSSSVEESIHEDTLSDEDQLNIGQLEINGNNEDNVVIQDDHMDISSDLDENKQLNHPNDSQSDEGPNRFISINPVNEPNNEIVIESSHTTLDNEVGHAREIQIESTSDIDSVHEVNQTEKKVPLTSFEEINLLSKLLDSGQQSSISEDQEQNQYNECNFPSKTPDSKKLWSFEANTLNPQVNYLQSFHSVPPSYNKISAMKLSSEEDEVLTTIKLPDNREIGQDKPSHHVRLAWSTSNERNGHFSSSNTNKEPSVSLKRHKLSNSLNKSEQNEKTQVTGSREQVSSLDSDSQEYYMEQNYTIACDEFSEKTQGYSSSLPDIRKTKFQSSVKLSELSDEKWECVSEINSVPSKKSSIWNRSSNKELLELESTSEIVTGDETPNSNHSSQIITYTPKGPSAGK